MADNHMEPPKKGGKVKAELAKIRAMGFKEGAGYVWFYYKVWIIVPICLVLAILALTHGNDIRTQVLQISVSAELYYDDPDYFSSFDQVSGCLDPKREYTNADPITRYGIYANMMQSIWIATDQLDIIIADKTVTDSSMNMGAFYDLEEFLPEDLVDSLQDRFYHYENEEYGVNGNYAVNLRDCFDIEDADGTYAEGIFLFIPSNTKNPEMTVNYLRYLLEHPEKDFVHESLE